MASPRGDPSVVGVVVAEFDIEKGSVIRAQHPAPLDAAEDALAELMLPEGAHNHEADWTYFALRPMLARDRAADKPVGVDAYVFRTHDGGRTSPSGTEGAWIPYCADEQLTLTIDVADGGARALVLAAGRAERLRTSLHAELQYTVLQDAFASCYCEDGSALGLHFHSALDQVAFSERLDAAIPDVDDGSTPVAHAAHERATGADAGAGSDGVFATHDANRASALARMVDARASASPSPSLSPSSPKRIGARAARPLVWVLNLVCTRKDRRIRRGAEVKAIAIATTDRFLHVYKPVLVQAMKQLLADSAAAVSDSTTTESVRQPAAANGTHAGGGAQPARELLGAAGGTLAARAIAAKVYNSLLTVDLLALSPPTPLEREAERFFGACAGPLATGTAAPRAPTHVPTAALWAGSAIAVRVPRFLDADELADARATQLVRTFGAAAVQIQRALLCAQRVLFIGQAQRASAVCAHVLAAPLLVSPPLPPILLRRTFPYANLNDLSFLEVPAYVAGVTNPMFACRTGWWDLLCDVDTGQVLRPPRTQPTARDAHGADDGGAAGGAADARDGAGWAVETADEAALGTRLVAGVGAQLPEGWVRECFRERARALVASAAAALVASGGAGAAAARAPAVALAAAMPYASTADARLALRAARTNAALSRAIRAAASGELHAADAPGAARAAVERLRGLRARGGRVAAPHGGAGAAERVSTGAADGREVLVGAAASAELSGGEACELLATLLDAALDEASLVGLLSGLDATCATGALTPVALLVLHSAAEVRALAARLLQRLETWPQLAPCVRALNPMLLVAYNEQLRHAGATGA